MLEGLDKVIHTDNTTNVSRIVSEEDTTKGGECTHQVSLESDGSLDAQGVDPACGGRTCTTSHWSEIVW